MTQPVLPLMSSGAPAGEVRGAKVPADEAGELRQRFEQMLWAEMLSHAGLEKAFTQGGGEGASAFSRYVVESIARDLAEKHPLGLGEKLPVAEPVAEPTAAGMQEE